MPGMAIGSLSEYVAAAVNATNAQQALFAAQQRVASGTADGSAPPAPEGNGSLINVMA